MRAIELQSKDHRDLLDIIDRLRSKGFGKYVDLPELVVCGDQSAGKSSVLEAISGLSFPTKDNLCTRFATELVLRRSSTPAIRVSIIPGPERSAEERERLGLFSAEVDTVQPDVGAVVEGAKKAMGLSDVKIFSTDILRIELCGPSQPHLTMVDLPGLFRAGNRDQSVQDAAIVRNMVQGYVKRPRSIILTVVSAKNDFALQEITEMARKLDPSGTRTLGLITKPDTLDVGSDSEAAYLRLAQNKDVEFRLGWHILKNRDYEMRGATSAERDEAEDQFFRTGVWATMDPNNVGVASLKPRLSHVLRNQILQQLPSLLQDVASEIASCNNQLQRLGTPRTTVEEQRRYLFQVSREFTFLMQAAVDGEYSNPFFGSARTAKGYSRRLRARVQNILHDFADDMHINGQSQILVDALPENNQESSSRYILRSDYIDEVKQLMRHSRGRELSGTFNPLIVSELFAEQCKPWEGIVIGVKEKILHAIDEVTNAIVNHVAVDETASGIFSRISTVGGKFRSDLDSEIKKLLEPHLNRHPITYNHYLTDNVEKAQEDRRCKKLSDAFEELVGPEYFKKGKKVEVHPYDLFNKLKRRTQVDMQLYAGELATDYMEAYYKVACKNLIDAVGVLAVEQCLVGKLPSLFQAELIMDLEVDEIALLAQESHGAASNRAQCKEKLAVLEAGKDDLHRLDSHRSLMASTLLLASNSQCPQNDDKSAHHIANNFGDKSGIIINSLGRASSAVESTSVASESDDEKLKRVFSAEQPREKPEAVKNGTNLWNWQASAAEPEFDFSLPNVTSKKDKKKKKKAASLWDEQ